MILATGHLGQLPSVQHWECPIVRAPHFNSQLLIDCSEDPLYQHHCRLSILPETQAPCERGLQLWHGRGEGIILQLITFHLACYLWFLPQNHSDCPAQKAVALPHPGETPVQREEISLDRLQLFQPVIASLQDRLHFSLPHPPAYTNILISFSRNKPWPYDI